jgi:hypothetical protein
VQRPGDTQEHVAGGIKFIDEAGRGLVPAESYPEVAPDILNAIRSKPPWISGSVKDRIQVKFLLKTSMRLFGPLSAAYKKSPDASLVIARPV